MTVTPSLGLTTTSQAAGSAVTFLDWRLAVNGNTVSNMLIIDAYSGSSGSVVLNTGKSGSQTIPGGNTASGSLFLQSTTNATKGKIFLGANSAYDESGSKLGIGITNPTQSIETNGNIKCGSSGSTNYIYFTTGSSNNPGVRYNNSGSSIEISDNGTTWYKPREVLSGSRIYYVATTGSDTNTGLASGSAFATIQKAIDTVAALDINIYDVTIQLEDGTYSNSTGNILKMPIGSGKIIILGNSGSPSNVIVTTTGTNPSNFYNSPGTAGIWQIQNLKLTSTGTGTINAIFANGNGANIYYGNIIFSTGFSIHKRADNYSVISALSPGFTIESGAGIHCQSNNATIIDAGATVTISGSPAWSVCGWNTLQGRLGLNSMTFSSGSANVTGQRYIATQNGVIYTAGGGANYLPGNSAGATASGGAYV